MIERTHPPAFDECKDAFHDIEEHKELEKLNQHHSATLLMVGEAQETVVKACSGMRENVRINELIRTRWAYRLTASATFPFGSPRGPGFGHFTPEVKKYPTLSLFSDEKRRSPSSQELRCRPAAQSAFCIRNPVTHHTYLIRREA